MSSKLPSFNRKENMLVWIGAMVQRGDRFLFLRRHRNRKNWGGKWQLVGGLMEWGESPLQTMEREIMEETGLRVSKPEYAGSYTSMLRAGDGTRYHTFLVVFHAMARGSKVRLSDEHDDFRWMTIREAKRADLFKDLDIFLDGFSRRKR